MNCEDNQKLVEQLKETFKFIYEHLDISKIKKSVDDKGIKSFINDCALLAGGTGAMAGAGGVITLLFGIPLNIANTVTQEFRVAWAIIYDKTGNISPSFEQTLKIVGLSVGVEIGYMGIQYLAIQIAQEIIRRLVVGSLGSWIPVIGSVTGFGLNYGFIKAIGTTLLHLNDDIFD